MRTDIITVVGIVGGWRDLLRSNGSPWRKTMISDELDDAQVTLTVQNPLALREYVVHPEQMVKRIVSADRTSDDHCRRLRYKLERVINGDKKLQAQCQEFARICELASLIVHNPKLRADYLQNPAKVLASAIPRKGLERLTPGAGDKTKTLRAALGDTVESFISADSRLVSAREAYFERRVFLDQALQHPDRTFHTITRLSWVALLAGVGFLAGAFLAAIFGSGTAEKALLAGLSGAGGVIGTFGTIFLLCVGSIRRANGENAQLRLILTDYAAELTHYRAISIQTLEDAQKINQKIRDLTAEAVRSIQDFVEPKDVAAAEEQQLAPANGQKTRRLLALPGKFLA